MTHKLTAGLRHDLILQHHSHPLTVTTTSRPRYCTCETCWQKRIHHFIWWILSLYHPLLRAYLTFNQCISASSRETYLPLSHSHDRPKYLSIFQFLVLTGLGYVGICRWVFIKCQTERWPSIVQRGNKDVLEAKFTVISLLWERKRMKGFCLQACLPCDITSPQYWGAAPSNFVTTWSETAVWASWHAEKWPMKRISKVWSLQQKVSSRLFKTYYCWGHSESKFANLIITHLANAKTTFVHLPNQKVSACLGGSPV